MKVGLVPCVAWRSLTVFLLTGKDAKNANAAKIYRECGFYATRKKFEVSVILKIGQRHCQRRIFI